MAEGFAQIAPNSTGDRVRTNDVILLQPDGTRVTVSMQIVSVADQDGNIIGLPFYPLNVDSKNLGDLIEDLTDEIRQLKTIMSLQCQ